MYQMMCRILPHYGLERYEISSFARKGYRSRHNLKYWDLSHYLGLGPAACSRIGHARKENNPGVRLYEKEVLSGNLPPEEVENLSVKDEMEEYCFLHLRTREGIPLQDFDKSLSFAVALRVADRSFAINQSQSANESLSGYGCVGCPVIRQKLHRDVIS